MKLRQRTEKKIDKCQEMGKVKNISARTATIQAASPNKIQLFHNSYVLVIIYLISKRPSVM